MGAKNGTTTEIQEKASKKKIESKYDPKTLRVLIKEGLDAATIMERMQIRHRQTLKQHVGKLISTDRVLYEVKGLYLKGSKRAKVNQQGILKINLKAYDLGDLEINEDDEFAVEASDGKIILTKILP
ncbi:hypothetical protein [Solidesulfovibrio magneticus]|uniref:Uncharacterized protein n=1 Tax=Solidesulfovibrio magneticus (strain ATCC 700980 / DSM 13731 / RS-1) TaxID=573370 RepID=C4XKP2_SOLM1|nr:hypothetical protein [Solidesulfovibrio magneticus]BAH74433.1 hypothetical protein DMR_09420 [Solidesulfovibrio magneticus RS-1]